MQQTQTTRAVLQGMIIEGYPQYFTSRSELS